MIARRLIGPFEPEEREVLIVRKIAASRVTRFVPGNADEDGDGFITFPEFTSMMNKFVRASELVDRFTLQSQISNKTLKKKDKSTIS